MRIEKVVPVKGVGGYFFDDQSAIKSGLSSDGFIYEGAPKTSGFMTVRMPSESICIALILDNGDIALGDCCAVQYSGVGGRDRLFLAEAFIPWINEHMRPKLLGFDCSSFKGACEVFDSCTDSDGHPAHAAIRYGVTQALLDAVAKSRGCTMTEVVTHDYGIPLDPKPIKIYAQSGDERYMNVDKMILKQVDVMPHGLINDPFKKVGPGGDIFLEYVRWVRERIVALRQDENYTPELHFDVYGTFGIVFGNDFAKIVDYLGKLAETAAPFQLRVESPIDMGSRDGQVEGLKEICCIVEGKGIPVEIVADEWCNTLEDIEFFASEHAGHMIQIKTPDLGGINNTIEAVMICKRIGSKAYQGGTCTETDISARVCTQVALAVQPYQILAKPGMGVDEGLMVVRNEMQRTMKLLQLRMEQG